MPPQGLQQYQGRFSSPQASLVEICKDAEAKKLYFTTPLALGTKRRWPKTDKDDNKLRKTQPREGGDAKGKGKGKGGDLKGGKGTGREQKDKWVWKSPGGRELCFTWNNGQECDGSCGRLHACRVKGCLKDHPAKKHGEKA